VFLLSGGSLLAAGRPDEPQTPGAELRAEAQQYAVQLLYHANAVSEQYVRPIPVAELLRTALQGLYVAARVPVPGGLDADLRRPLSDPELVQFLARLREKLGDVEPLRGPNALLVSCEAMCRCLDRYSAVVRGEELRKGNGVDQRTGLGLELADSFGTGPLVIKAVVPGGPAQLAGLRPGEEITHLDGKPVQGMTSAEAMLLCDYGLPGPGAEDRAAAEVELTVRRPGSGEARRVTLERQEYRPETVLGVVRRRDNRWDYMVDRERGLAQVRIAALGNGTALQVRETVTALQAEGLRGVILDLRWCPGGYLREAVNVASLFLGDCTVATVRSRGSKDTVYPSTAENKFLDFPVVVLVNGDTSGGAELIAAALQDHKRAVIVGQRTLGKASIQTMVPLGVPNAGLKLTSGVFVRPSGKNLHRGPDSTPGDDWGVRPDPKMDVRVSPELGRRLRDWWTEQTLRPGTSTEALPLDDPTADPQRLAALRVLRGMLTERAAGVTPAGTSPAAP
jgi:carboxyl-terminal processing protease